MQQVCAAPAVGSAAVARGRGSALKSALLDTLCLQTRRTADGVDLGDRCCCCKFTSKAVGVPCARIQRTVHVC